MTWTSTYYYSKALSDDVSYCYCYHVKFAELFALIQERELGQQLQVVT